MNSDKKEESQELLDYITNFQFFDEKGWFNLEPFCVYLNACLKSDGLDQNLPTVESIDELFYVVVSELMGTDSKTYVKRQRVIDWQPGDSWIFPNVM